MKLNLQPKLVEKLVWVPVISFCKIFIAGYLFDALLGNVSSFLDTHKSEREAKNKVLLEVF